MVSERMLRGFCPSSFFSCSMQRACHNYSSLVGFFRFCFFLTCNSMSLPTAKWLSWKPKPKATSPTDCSALYGVPCMRATKRAKRIARWKINSVWAGVERNKDDEEQKPGCWDVERSKATNKSWWKHGVGWMGRTGRLGLTYTNYHV